MINGDCGTGYDCAGGFCVLQCTVDADCAAGYSCTVGFCDLPSDRQQASWKVRVKRTTTPPLLSLLEAPWEVRVATAGVADGHQTVSLGEQVLAPPITDVSGEYVGRVTLVAQGVPGTPACAPGAEAETFAPNMVGCSGTALFAERPTLCGSTWDVCTPEEWVGRRAGQAPSLHYWTSELLKYGGSTSGMCSASVTAPNSCGLNSSMLVCGGKGLDRMGNACVWGDCGFNSNAPIEYFGGCSSRASTLCCRGDQIPPGSAHPDLPAKEQMNIKVTAWATGTDVVFFDETRTLSPSGVIAIGAPGVTANMLWLGSSWRDPTSSLVKDDAMIATVSTANAHTQNPDGTLTGGRFAVMLPSDPPRELIFEYELAWQRGFTGSSCPGCATNEYCETGLDRCVPGADWRTTYQRSNQFIHRQAEEWLLAGAWLQSDSPFLGTQSHEWAEQLLCWGAGGLPSGSFKESYLFAEGDSDVVLTHSGDLFCEDNALPRQVGLDIARDYNERFGGGWPISASTLLAACVDSLWASPPVVSGTTIPEKHDSWFVADESCVSLARLFPAIEWVVRKTLAGNAAVGPVSRDFEADQLAHRLFSQWLNMHSFVAKQRLGELGFDRVFGDVDYSVGVEDTLAFMELGLDLILQSKYSRFLTTMSRSALQRPDYRAPTPIAYWTFDPNDSNGTLIRDVVGDKHLRLGFAPTGALAPGFGWGIATNQVVGIPKLPADFSDDVTVSWWMTWPTLAPGAKAAYLEYRDDKNLAFRFGIELDGFTGNYWTFAEHGSFSAGTIEHVRIVEFTTQPPANTPIFVAFSRKDGAIQRTYTSYIRWSAGTMSGDNGALMPFPATLGAGERGVLSLRDSFDDLVIWDTMLGPSFFDELYLHDQSGSIQNGSIHDNTALEPFSITSLFTEDHEQGLGLEVTILETAAEYMRTLATYLDERSWTVYQDCYQSGDSVSQQRALDRMGRALRYAAALESLARNLHDRSSHVGCNDNADCASGFCVDYGQERVCGDIANEPVLLVNSWQERWDDALAEFAAARGRAITTGRKVVDCSNPLGVADSALPLFFGDVAGPNSRYFAASDYLTEHWVTPAVAQATSALDQAQTAWLSKRNSEIQELQTNQQRQQRLEQIELQYATPVQELCGLWNMDTLQILEAFENGFITVDSCFTNPGCAPGDTSASCYNGRLGASAIAVLAANQDVQVAQSRADGLVRQFETKSEFCAEKQVRLAGDVNALADHQSRMQSLREQKRIMEAASGFFGALAGLASMPPDVGGLVGAATNLATMGLDEQMESEQASFELNMQARSNEEVILACFHEATMIKIGFDSAWQEIKRRRIDVELAVLHLREGAARAQQLVTEGIAALRREAARTTPSVAHHYWLAPKVETFKRDFAWAKRLTFLALLAVEYEFQQSLPQRGSLPGASTPVELQDALSALNFERAARTINGRRPAELLTVRSLRSDILRIESHNDVLPGERTWSADQRFADRLGSAEFAVYADGVYLGQGIRFTLREQAEMQLRCGERLWRVGATIQGDIVGVDSPAAPVVLLKRNTFTSQWCDGHGDGSAYQVGSISPTAQLFHPSTDPAPESDTDGYRASLLYPWFNVRRTDFYRQAYVEGSSEEFAGHGLYGDYILLFPEAGMLNWTDLDPDNDFPLDRIEDVLLRFDYLSVDDITGL